KRLALARDLLKTGMPVTEACFGSGFKNYSTFFRAYKKHFHVSPSETVKEHGNI
ncbi:MAG TPA: AraC family transcriptional regulator, partial [Lachnoclostridium sp.]|nr:AraC family transcriptional regulator [Lachnoclostridium sp.]